ncbi:hypothetical protein TSUD_324210 [Trifolium subterraneum]|uniref:Uncharacterized protein n=1 Tax=Trifolium subterraneum TaxID=3900 RepID=A0A2Z6MGJ5_TRISU|nr:hypothetical protein TSUD_324210 [Trifolium subterraneum]
MSLQGKHVIQILGMLMLISLATANEVSQKENLGQCLGKCGEGVLSCVVGCYNSKLQNFLGCAMKCEGTNTSCMTKCTRTIVPPVP